MARKHNVKMVRKYSFNTVNLTMWSPDQVLASLSPENLWEIHIPRYHSRPTESELSLNKPPGDLDAG